MPGGRGDAQRIDVLALSTPLLFLVSAAVVLGFDAQSSVSLWHAPLPSWLLGGIGIGLLLSAWPLDG